MDANELRSYLDSKVKKETFFIFNRLLGLGKETLHAVSEALVEGTITVGDLSKISVFSEENLNRLIAIRKIHALDNTTSNSLSSFIKQFKVEDFFDAINVSPSKKIVNELKDLQTDIGFLHLNNTFYTDQYFIKTEFDTLVMSQVTADNEVTSISELVPVSEYAVDTLFDGISHATLLGKDETSYWSGVYKNAVLRNTDVFTELDSDDVWKVFISTRENFSRYSLNLATINNLRSAVYPSSDAYNFIRDLSNQYYNSGSDVNVLINAAAQLADTSSGTNDLLSYNPYYVLTCLEFVFKAIKNHYTDHPTMILGHNAADAYAKSLVNLSIVKNYLDTALRVIEEIVNYSVLYMRVK